MDKYARIGLGMIIMSLISISLFIGGLTYYIQKKQNKEKKQKNESIANTSSTTPIIQSAPVTNTPIATSTITPIDSSSSSTVASVTLVPMQPMQPVIPVSSDSSTTNSTNSTTTSSSVNPTPETNITPTPIAPTPIVPAPISTPISPASTMEVELFETCGYSGWTQKFKTGDYKYMPDVGVSANTVSSVKVPKGCTLKLYESPGYAGKELIITEDVNCLTSKDFDNQSSSFKVTC
jgi:hypothetical protein